MNGADVGKKRKGQLLRVLSDITQEVTLDQPSDTLRDLKFDDVPHAAAAKLPDFMEDHGCLQLSLRNLGDRHRVAKDELNEEYLLNKLLQDTFDIMF